MRDEEFQKLFGGGALSRLQDRSVLELPAAKASAAMESGGGLLEATDMSQLRGLLLLMLPVMLLWHTWLVYPLKMLVVFLHELSHGLMALLTSGSIIQIQLMAQEGGLCISAGGNRFLVASAGYLGSLLWGAVLLIAASRTRYPRQITFGLGALLLAVALLFVRPLFGFGLLFCLLAGAGLLFAGLRLSERQNDFLLKFIGLTSILYVPQDILSDTILRLGLMSDARSLAELTGIPTLVHGLVWGVLSLIIGAGTLLLAAGKKR